MSDSQVLPSSTEHLVPHTMSVDDDLNAAALAARDEMRSRHLQPEDLAAYAVAGRGHAKWCALHLVRGPFELV